MSCPSSCNGSSPSEIGGNRNFAEIGGNRNFTICSLHKALHFSDFFNLQFISRPRLLDFVSSLDEELVKSASQKAFESLPDISKAVSEFTILKGVGPATASAVLAAYAPHVAPFMSDEAMEAALGSSKDYTWKRYLSFVDELQEKTKELSSNVDLFTTSGVERALWGSSVCAKLLASQPDPDPKSRTSRDTKERENVEVMVLGD